MYVLLCCAVLCCAHYVQPSVLPHSQQQQQQQSTVVPQTSSWQVEPPKDPQQLLQEAEQIRQLLLRNRYDMTHLYEVKQRDTRLASLHSESYHGTPRSLVDPLQQPQH